jgi:hypothetical protein
MKLPAREEIIELWLYKYHGITVDQLLQLHPEEVKSADWFRLYPVTQAQSDQWVRDAKQMLRQKYKVSKWMIERGWPYVFLDCAPFVLIE